MIIPTLKNIINTAQAESIRKHSDFVTIHCGLQNAAPAVAFFNFWPVLKATLNSIPIVFNEFQSPYKLIFSSKTAINFFYEEVFRKNINILTNCHCVYFTGTESKLHFEKIFPKDWHSIARFASDEMGMKNLIGQFNLTASELKLIFFTASVGRSKTIVESMNFLSQSIIIPIYNVIAYESDFLQIKFSQLYREGDKKIIFECRSGQILEQTVIFLMKYFKCADILSLPENIYFSCFGNSTFDKANQFYAKSRTQNSN